MATTAHYSGLHATLYPHIASFMRYVYLVAFLFVSSFAYGQSIDKITAKKLLDASQMINQKAVVLIESDTLLISTTLNKLTHHFTEWLRLNPHLKEDKILFNKIQLLSKGSVIRADSIARVLKLKERLNYRIGSLLSAGNCFAYNKLTKKELVSVRIIDYSDSFTVCRKYVLDNYVVIDNVLAVY